MSRPVAAALLAAGLLTSGCGDADHGDLPVGLDVRLSALNGDEILQFVVLRDRDTSGNEVACTDFASACVAERRPRVRAVALDSGRCTHRVPLDLDAARTPDGQPISIPGIPPGRNYLVVVEIVRDGAGGEQRVGVGCLPVDQIVRGINPPPTTPIDVLDAGGCNPVFDGC